MGATHHARSSRDHERGAASHVLYRGRPLRHWLTIRLAEAVDICASARRVCVRAIRRLYSNISYSILAAALERAAGKPYIDYVQEEILRPLGMTSTSFFVTPDLAPRIAKGYNLREEKIDPDFPQLQNGHEGYWTPAGGVLSTVPDLAKLMRFQLGYGPNFVLSAESLKSAFSGIVASDADLLYGDGIEFSAVRNGNGYHVALGHGGLRRGYVASYEFDRSTKSDCAQQHQWWKRGLQAACSPRTFHAEPQQPWRDGRSASGRSLNWRTHVQYDG
jgi:CubicO group peptidase (beta-lactamase class C family)